MVRSGRHAAGEWTFEGGSNGASSVETDGLPPVIHRGAYDGARKRVDVLRQFGWYRRSSGFCPMVGTEAVFLFRFAPAQPDGHLPLKIKFLEEKPNMKTMNLKKLCAVMLAIVMLLTMAACAGKSNTPAVETPAQLDAPAAEETPAAE